MENDGQDIARLTAMPRPQEAGIATAARQLASHRKPLFAEDFPIILLFSQKSGCTTTVKWFFWHAGVLDEALAYNAWIHRYEGQVFKKRQAYKNELIAELCRGKKRLVKFTRDPFPRAVSSFLTLSSGALRNKKHFGHQAWADIRAHKYGDPGASGGASFMDFLHYLRDTGATLDKVNGHLALQYQQEESAFAVEYYKIENVAPAFRSIEASLGLVPSPESLLSSRHHNQYAPGAIEDVSTLVIDQHTFVRRTPPQYRAFYSPAAIELAREIFRPDFRHYGYPDSL